MSNKKAQVQDIFKVRIATILDFLALAHVPQVQLNFIKKQLWRIYDNCLLLRECSDVKVQEVFRIRIGFLMGELEKTNCPPFTRKLIKKYIWNLFNDLQLMEQNLYWGEVRA